MNHTPRELLFNYDSSMRKRGTQEGSVRFKGGKWYGSYFLYVAALDGTIEYKRREVALDAGTKRAGAPMGQRIRMMGHAEGGDTLRYIHADNDSQREALERATGKLRVQ